MLVLINPIPTLGVVDPPPHGFCLSLQKYLTNICLTDYTITDDHVFHYTDFATSIFKDFKIVSKTI